MITIGQGDVINFLKECEKPVTRKQIADGLGCDPVLISHILRDLLRFKEINFIEYPRDKASEMVEYVILRRTRFFFLAED